MKDLHKTYYEHNTAARGLIVILELLKPLLTLGLYLVVPGCLMVIS
jgi:hypothetical protein